MNGKGAGDADLGNMGAFDFSALQGVLNVRLTYFLVSLMQRPAQECLLS